MHIRCLCDRIVSYCYHQIANKFDTALITHSFCINDFIYESTMFNCLPMCLTFITRSLKTIVDSMLLFFFFLFGFGYFQFIQTSADSEKKKYVNTRLCIQNAASEKYDTHT